METEIVEQISEAPKYDPPQSWQLGIGIMTKAEAIRRVEQSAPRDHQPALLNALNTCATEIVAVHAHCSVATVKGKRRIIATIDIREV